MTKTRFSTLVLAGTVSLVAVGAAQAGGFNRGSANLDGLFGGSQFGSIYTGMTYVAPGRSYDEVTGVRVVLGAPALFAQSDVEFADNYWVPYGSVGGRLNDNVSCVGSYSQPYGADSTYSGAITFHIAAQSLASNEFGLTCGYGMDLSKGRLSIIGGVFYETIEYEQARNFLVAFGNAGDSTLNLKSRAFGYRVGVGYEIPEIALKATLMYRSQTDHDATGTYFNTPFRTLAIASGTNPIIANALYGTATTASAQADASLPQQVELAVQSGIAEGWLAFASVKWTDWSVLQQLQVTEGIAGQPFSTSRFFFDDGWTVTGGIARRFNEQLAGSVSLTWDKGVTSGWDTLTDTYTVAGGISFDASKNINFRVGGAAIYFTEGDKSKVSSAVDYTAHSPAEWGFAGSFSASAKF